MFKLLYSRLCNKKGQQTLATLKQFSTSFQPLKTCLYPIFYFPITLEKKKNKEQNNKTRARNKYLFCLSKGTGRKKTKQ